MYSFDYRLGVKKLQIHYNSTHIMSCEFKEKQLGYILKFSHNKCFV